jgi:hypothetical protein
VFEMEFHVVKQSSVEQLTTSLTFILLPETLLGEAFLVPVKTILVCM